MRTTALIGGQILLLICSTLLLWRLSIHLGDIDRSLAADTAPPRVECRDATWPDIDETCLEQLDPDRW